MEGCGVQGERIMKRLSPAIFEHDRRPSLTTAASSRWSGWWVVIARPSAKAVLIWSLRKIRRQKGCRKKGDERRRLIGVIPQVEGTFLAVLREHAAGQLMIKSVTHIAGRTWKPMWWGWGGPWRGGSNGELLLHGKRLRPMTMAL